MRIAYCLVDSSQKGGMERIICAKANYLADQLGYEVLIITTDRNSKENYFSFSEKIIFHDLGVNYFELNQYSSPLRIVKQIKKRKEHKRKLANLLVDIQADIVISTYTHEFTLLCDIKEDNSIKIAEIHFSKEYSQINNKIKKQSFVLNLITTLAEKRKHFYIHKYNKFVVLTKSDLQNWKRCDNIVHIYNMLPFSTHSLSSLKNKRVISIGRLEPEKGFETLIDIWEIVIKEYPDWHLDIFGSGDNHEELQKQITRKRLTDSISINLPKKEISIEYLNSSLYVMTSYYEGFGMVLIEAMQCGVPCISFNCPHGPSEIIENGRTGFIIEDRNLQEFADKIIQLIENKELRIQMGRNAKKSSERFSPNSIMKEWDTLFKSLVE